MEPTSGTRRFATPTGDPCPRMVRTDGTVEGSGDCLGCGTCLQLAEIAYPDRPLAVTAGWVTRACGSST